MPLPWNPASHFFDQNNMAEASRWQGRAWSREAGSVTFSSQSSAGMEKSAVRRPRGGERGVRGPEARPW